MTPITIAKIILNIARPPFEHDPYRAILFRLDDALPRWIGQSATAPLGGSVCGDQASIWIRRVSRYGGFAGFLLHPFKTDAKH